MESEHCKVSNKVDSSAKAGGTDLFVARAERVTMQVLVDILVDESAADDTGLQAHRRSDLLAEQRRMDGVARRTS